MIAAMIPMKHSSIFKNRWFAILWAAGILWFAYDFIGEEPAADSNGAAAVTDATGAPVDDQQIKDLEKTIADL